MRVFVISATALTVVLACAAVRAATTSIDQVGQMFSEKSISVKPGDAVSFNNHDDVTHNINVIDDDDNATDLGLQKPGDTLQFKFDKVRKFKVRCSIHPSMKMVVSVK